MPEFNGVSFSMIPISKTWQTDDAYLSGNIREKLIQAEAAASQDPIYRENVDALKTVLPDGS